MRIYIQRLDSTRLTVTLTVNLTLKNIVIYKWIKISQKKIKSIKKYNSSSKNYQLKSKFKKMSRKFLKI